jgi:ATP-dependent Clp protease ATP-binding subunit ClpA
MTSNLGASEMSAIVSPGIGFNGTSQEDVRADGRLAKRIVSAGMTAARRKFTPEFMNRLDKVVVFQPLGDHELRSILDLELARVQERVFNGTPFLFQLRSAAKDRLLAEGTDAKYGARHLKRAIERSLVYSLANLIATQQVRSGDLVEVDYDPDSKQMTFERVDEGLPVYTMFRAAGIEMPAGAETAAAAAPFERFTSTTARGVRK